MAKNEMTGSTDNRPTRRGFLKTLGIGAGALTLVAVGGGLYRAHDQGLLRIEDPSLEAWRRYDGGVYSGPLALVAAAVLAANPHNTQPWIFKVEEREIRLYADFDRALGTMDPFERELYIGLGCALENIAVAAPGAGLEADITMMPQPGERRFAARISLSPAAPGTHPHAGVLSKRRTNRGPYDIGRPVAAEHITALSGVAGAELCRVMLFRRGTDEAKHFAAATNAATEAIVADHQMVDDSSRWFRYDQDKIDEERDGVTMHTVGLSPIVEVVARMMPPLSGHAAHESWIGSTREVHLATADHVGVIAVRTGDLFNDHTSLQAGRVWQRFHLEATTRGIAAHPMNQVPEQIARDRQLQRGDGTLAKFIKPLKMEGWAPTFMFRIGHAAQATPHSPRRTAEMVVKA